MSHGAGHQGRAGRTAVITTLVAGLAILVGAPLPAVAGLLPGADTSAPPAGLTRSVDRVTATVREDTAAVVRRASTVADRLDQAAAPAPAVPAVRAAAPRQTATDPQTQPPLHGATPHGQGSVAVVDLDPTNDRPTGGDPAGSDSGEDVVVGRARGEQRPTGTYHGHVTIVALFGHEIVGTDSNPGETKAGPLDAIQTGLLDALCKGSGGQLCASVLRADSATSNSGSTNHFSVAHATVGGANGLDVGAAESNGNIRSDGHCQTSHGDSSVAGVNAQGKAVATLAPSSTDSQACKGQAPTQRNSSSVLGLGGTGVPLPAPGCGDGTPDTQTGIPTLLPIVCNADDTNGQGPAPNGVREALSLFALATGTTAVAKVTAGAAESSATAPPAQCADGVDNDGDGLVDAADGGCHSDGNASNPSSYSPSDDDESGGGTTSSAGSSTTTTPSSGGQTTGSGSPTTGSSTSGGTSTSGNGGTGNATPVSGSSTAGTAPQCSDGVDNDGDGKIDAADPGCHSDGDASNSSSYVPSDDSEANGGAAATQRASSLPFTGADALVWALAGLMLCASGLALRRRLGDD